MSQMTAPKISVLGDGISSFEGYVPRQASFYSPSYVSYSGFDSPEGTWWMQLTKLLGGRDFGHNAYAGSHVSYAGHYSACLPRRIRSLATEDASQTSFWSMRASTMWRTASTWISSSGTTARCWIP